MLEPCDINIWVAYASEYGIQLIRIADNILKHTMLGLENASTAVSCLARVADDIDYSLPGLEYRDSTQIRLYIIV